MIFRQLFDTVSGTYTYLIASRHGGEALIIDPVLEKVDRYLIRDAQRIIEAIETLVRMHTAQEEDIYEAVAARTAA